MDSQKYNIISDMLYVRHIGHTCFRGKDPYSTFAFVQSVLNQFDERGTITDKQYDALEKIYYVNKIDNYIRFEQDAYRQYMKDNYPERKFKWEEKQTKNSNTTDDKTTKLEKTLDDIINANKIMDEKMTKLIEENKQLKNTVNELGNTIRSFIYLRTKEESLNATNIYEGQKLT